MKTRILHCITGLTKDGAQRMLYRLVAAMDRDEFENRVVSLRPEEPFADEFRAAGIPVQCLGMRGSLPSPAVLRALAASATGFKPHVIQGWMYHANLAALVARHFVPERPPVLWNIRTSIHDISRMKPLTRAIIKTSALLSGFPDRIIYCTGVSADQHEAAGYKVSKRIVLGNGFDTTRFAPSAERYASFRSEHGIPAAAPIVGIVGRYNPIKDHEGFVHVAGRVARSRPDIHFVMVGRGLERENATLAGIAKEYDISERLHLLGEKADVSGILPAFDVYASTSRSEGFPNVIAESLACGVPSVATDVGASAELVDSLGRVAAAGDYDGLAAGMLSLLDLPEAERRLLGERCRARIVSEYSLGSIVERYEGVYRGVVESRSRLAR